MSETRRYTRDGLTVVWQPKLCAHSKRCWQELGTVFKPRARPWIVLDGADEEAVKAQVARCPSGALSIE
jgi:uncharacterized Fe-S cluster protein YjdI